MESCTPTLKNIEEKDFQKIDKTEVKDSNEEPPSDPVDSQKNVEKRISLREFLKSSKKT